jgi:hypothetical protein
LRDYGIQFSGFGGFRVLHGAVDVHHLQSGVMEFLDQMRRRNAKA